MSDQGIAPPPAGESHGATSLIAVDRTTADLRRGLTILVRGRERRAILVQAAEAASDESLRRLRALGEAFPSIVLTGRRGRVLGLIDGGGEPVRMALTHGISAAAVRQLADPCGALEQPLPAALDIGRVDDTSCEAAAIQLTKIARLLPAAVTVAVPERRRGYVAEWGAAEDLLLVDVDDVFGYWHQVAHGLRRVSEAQVPLAGASACRIIAFRPIDGGVEHIAIVVGAPPADVPPMTRLHSECFTGDLLASLRCDCGDQLRGAIGQMAEAGSGILLYLAQEGRGIGLVNKLRAYELQDQGLDTLDANEQLGFDADERIYQPAAEMLRQLGFTAVRLLTNNPAKVDALKRHGIDVVDRVKHSFPSNAHNEGYLKTKATRFGHEF